MYQEKGHIKHFAELGVELKILDFENREFKANKAISVMEDFASKKGKDLSGMKGLDIGCSGGIITSLLAKRLEKVVGIDIDPSAVELARSTFSQITNLSFAKTDVLALPYQNETFDVVFCNHVYEHVSDFRRLFDEIHRIMKPDGFCYLGAGNRFVLIEDHYSLPLLSWLHPSLANLYFRLAGKGKRYEVRLLSLRNLKKSLCKFKIVDYSIEIIKSPTKYYATDVIRPDSLLTRLPQRLLYWLEPIMPAYVFILSKR